MGIFEKGILGGFSGKVGTVIGTTWRGKDVMRSRAKRKKNYVPSPKQLRQRVVFTLVANFLRPVNIILKDHFGYDPEGKTRGNKAMSYHMEHAIAGVMPNLSIDFEKVVLSIGKRLTLLLPTVTVLADAALGISWIESNVAQVESDGSDKVTFVAYCPAKAQYELRYPAATRADLSYTFQFNENWADESVHVWAFVTTEDGENCSGSLYLGAFDLI